MGHAVVSAVTQSVHSSVPMVPNATYMQLHYAVVWCCFLPCPQVYAALAADGVKRCTEIPLFKLLVLSLYASFYVSFGGLVSTSVVALLPGQ